MDRKHIVLIAAVLVLAALAATAALAGQCVGAQGGAAALGVMEDVLGGGVYCTRAQFIALLAQEGLVAPPNLETILSAPDWPVTRAQAALALNALAGRQVFDPFKPGFLQLDEAEAMIRCVKGAVRHDR